MTTTPATQAPLPVTPEPAIRWQGTEDEQHAARMKVCTERCALYNDDDCDRDGSCSECDVDMALELETPASLRHRLAYWQGRAATAESQAHSLPGDALREAWISDAVDTACDGENGKTNGGDWEARWQRSKVRAALATEAE